MKTITRTFFLLLIMCSLLTAKGQSASTIKAQALEMARALLKKDYPTFAKYVHPKLVAMAGGTPNLIKRLDTANAAAKQFGAEIKKINIGNPDKIVTYKNELQTTIPQTTEMSMMMGSVILESTLIATSTDGGKTWRFLDTSLYSVKEIKKAVPELSPELVIPPAKPPKMVPNQQ